MKIRTSSGFTMIELLASMSVLLVLMTVLSQVVGMASSSWLTGKARIDAFSQARTTLSAMDRDFKRMVLRPDLAAFTDSAGSASALAFYTRVQGGTGDRSVSLVEYQIQSPSTEPKLVRSDYGLDFSGASAPSFGQPDRLPDLAKVQTRDLAPGVVRMEWKFLDGMGTENDSFVYDYANPGAETNTRAVRVSMLVLDSSSYALLLNTGDLSGLLARTEDSGRQSGESLGQYWENLISTSALSGTVPKPVLKSLRVFERSINIPTGR